MSTSDELRAALNRRLKKIDVAVPENVAVLSPVRSENRDGKVDPLSQQAYRSGWSMTPPIPRSEFLPPPLLNNLSPTKSDLGIGRVCIVYSCF